MPKGVATTYVGNIIAADKVNVEIQSFDAISAAMQTKLLSEDDSDITIQRALECSENVHADVPVNTTALGDMRFSRSVGGRAPEIFGKVFQVNIRALMFITKPVYPFLHSQVPGSSTSQTPLPVSHNPKSPHNLWGKQICARHDYTVASHVVDF